MECVTKIRTNNFFKQNIFNEKLNITKNPFTWTWGICLALGILLGTWGIPVEHNYSIYFPLA